MASLGQRISNRDNPDYRVRYRSLELCVENLTDFRLELLGDYFETGVWHDNPGHHLLEPQSNQQYIVTSKMGGFLVGVTGVIKYSVVGAGCFLFICFSAPVVGAYKTKVALHARDYPAGTEYQDLLTDRFSAVKYKDMVASVEVLDSTIGCKKQFVFRLTLQQPIERSVPRKSVDMAEGETHTEPTPSSQPSTVMPPPPPPPPPPGPPPPPPPSAPPPSAPPPTGLASSGTPLPQIPPDHQVNINSQILAGVKLRSVPVSSPRDKVSEESNTLVQIIGEAMDQRRTMMDSDSEYCSD